MALRVVKNVFILGSGRSGTSLAAGCLASAGYYMGESLLEPREANPKGFFEAVEVNELNEEILASFTPPRPPYGKGRFLFRHRPLHMQRWLAVIPSAVRVTAPADVVEKMKRVVASQPFCLKDPRFCYTLPAWRQLVDNDRTVFVCIFRDPSTTVESIMKECRAFPPLADHHSGIAMSRRRAWALWCSMYEHILLRHAREGDWLFLHYEQLFTAAGIRRLEEKTGAITNMNFPTRSLQRMTGGGSVPGRARRIYRDLCRLAGFP